MIYSPLDQFKIAPLLSILNLQVLIIYYKFFFIAPSGWQNLLEKIYALVTQLLSDIITTGSEKYFSFYVIQLGLYLNLVKEFTYR